MRQEKSVVAAGRVPRRRGMPAPLQLGWARHTASQPENLFKSVILRWWHGHLVLKELPVIEYDGL